MLAAVAETGADIALGHWRGPSADMYARAEYARVGREVAAELRERIAAAAAAGIAPSRIILDPGIGFAKNAGQNWELLRELGDVVALGPRVLVGTSRKRFLAERPGRGRRRAPQGPGDRGDERARPRVPGVWAVRVHEVAATRDAPRRAERLGRLARAAQRRGDRGVAVR